MHMHHAHGKCFDGLARKRTAGGVAHGHREHNFNRLYFCFGSASSLGCFNASIVCLAVSTESSLRVQRVKNRFDEDGVNAFFHQDGDLF